jgi:hypothetical protein
VVQAGLSKKEDSISKITITKRTGDVAQVLECLPSQHKALNSNPSTTHTHTHKNSGEHSNTVCFYLYKVHKQRKTQTSEREEGTFWNCGNISYID